MLWNGECAREANLANGSRSGLNNLAKNGADGLGTKSLLKTLNDARAFQRTQERPSGKLSESLSLR
jgi:hypothetical protein